MVGGSAALVRDGRIVARHHYGFADRASGRRVGDSTLYRWASITKTLTAVAVLQLRDRDPEMAALARDALAVIRR